MSDAERGKFYGKKRYGGNRERSENNFGSRFFNSKNAYKHDKEFSKESDESKGKQKSIKQPTILLKAPERIEERAASPKQKETDTSAPITIATNSTHENVPVSVVKEMVRSAKLLDDGTLYTDHIQDMLLENNDFVVVGIVGAQGVGKSTILNLLAADRITNELKEAIFKVPIHEDEDSIDNIKILTDEMYSCKIASASNKRDKIRQIFREESLDDTEANINTTCGIDMYVTRNRMILLDCQPIMSSAILEDLMCNESKRSNVISEFLPLENSVEIQGLQLTAFLMSVCHVLVAVNDWFYDSNLIRFLQTAENLKPTISNPEEEFVDYFPHLILLQNKAQMQDFTPARFRTMQKLYKLMFKNSKMHLESGLGLGTGRIINSLCPENSGPPINLFLIPEYDQNTEGIFKGHPPLEELIGKLKANLMGSVKYSLTHVQLTEKNWLVYSAKVWDHVKKSSFFVEYTKLMP